MFHPMALSFSPVLDYVLPRHAKRSEYKHRQYRDSLLFNMLVTLALIIALALLSQVGESEVLTALFSFSSVACLTLLALLRTGLSLSYINTISVFVVSSLVVALVCVTGGLYSPVTSWMVALPLVTVVLMRGKLAVSLLCLQAIPVAGFTYCAFAGIQFPQLLSEEHYDYAFLFAILSAWLVGVISISSHRHWQTQLTNSLSVSANVDPLTGLMSRGYFEQRARQALGYAFHDGDPLSFIMIDMDRLKEINDEHGHATGDTMLALVARLILTELRAGDFCGRIGGDEYCAVLPRASLADAENVASRLNAAVGKVSPRRKRDVVTPVSISVGVATYDGVGDPSPVEEYLDEADQRMYRHKISRRAA